MLEPGSVKLVPHYLRVQAFVIRRDLISVGGNRFSDGFSPLLVGDGVASVVIYPAPFGIQAQDWTSPVPMHCVTLVLPRRTILKTVRDACELQPNALSIKLSDQIEQLDQLITAEGDGAEFFGKTQITHGMQDLISEGIARLAGASSQAVFHLKQAMGGGKTHLLVGFGLLAK